MRPSGRPQALFPELYKRLVEKANAEQAEARRGYAPFVPAVPDICIANFFTGEGKLNMHQDKSETRESIAAGSCTAALLAPSDGNQVFVRNL